MYRAGFSLVAALALGPAMAAGEAVRLGDLADGSTVYLASVDASASPHPVRMRRVFPAPRTIGGVGGILSEIAWQRVDCRARTSETDRLEWYGNAEATGIPLQELDLPPALRGPVFIPPGDRSAFGSILDAVCGKTSVAQSGNPPPAAGAYPPAGPPANRPPVMLDPVPVPYPPPAGQGAPDHPGSGSGGITPLPGPGGRDGPAQPWDEPPPQDPDVPAGVRPPGTGPIADLRPFPDSVFTLGTMGRLAQYVYYDPERLRVLTASGERMSRLEGGLASGSVFHGLVRAAIARNDKERVRYGAALADKQAMLGRASLVAEPLPRLRQSTISAFRAELYRHVPSGQLILVFRGSQEPLDWFSNLWLGVDLLALEAPHYDAARRLTEQVVKTGRRPIVVGHSLGGGMAQYVGQMFSLPVVAFNSSPLPSRYIPSKGKAGPDRVRLFSAIEYQGGPERTVTRADPVSLTLPRMAETYAATFGYAPHETVLKAHQHLVMPVCVVSRPEPFRTEEEQAQIAKIVNTAMNPSVLGYLVTGKPMHGAMEKGMEVWISQAVGKQLKSRDWQAESNQPFDVSVSKHMKETVADVAIDAFQNAQGAAKMGKVAYDGTFGNIWKAVGTVGVTVAKVAAKIEANAMLMPHSMARFNRGMQAAVSDDVFIARTVAAQCQKTATTY